MKKELAAVRARYRQLWERLRPREACHELSTVPQGEGTHVEFKDGEYRYIVSERGAYMHVQATSDADELAYWMAIDLTLPLLGRVADHRQWLERQAELLGKIDPEWQARRRKEMLKILPQNRQ